EKRRISSWVGRLTVGPGALLIVALVASLAVLTLLAGAAAIGPLLLLNEAALLTLLAVVPFAGSVISAVYLDRRHGERAGADIAAARRWLATLPMSTTSRRQVLLVPPALAVALLPAVVSWAASTQAPPSAPAVQFQPSSAEPERGQQ